MKLLIFETVAGSCADLQSALSEATNEVQTVQTADTIRELSETHDLLLIDADSIDDGTALVAKLREAGSELPIILFSEQSAIQDRVRALSAGADDYVMKPYANEELIARAIAVLRRAGRRGPISSAQAQVGDLQLDLLRNRALRAGKSLKLTPKEFSLLSLLVRRRGQVLTRQLIAREVWDSSLDGATNVVDVHVRRLRSKVDDPFEHKLIQTVRGVGYTVSGNGP